MPFSRLWPVLMVLLLFAKCGEAGLRQVTEMKNRAYAGSSGDLLACSPDGKLIAVLGSRGIGLFNAQTRARLFLLKGHPYQIGLGSLSGLVFTADSQTLITCGYDGVVCFWNTGTAKLLREIETNVIWILEGAPQLRLPMGAMPLHSLAYSPRSQIVVAMCHDKTVRLRDRQTGKYWGMLGKPEGKQLALAELNLDLPAEEDASHLEFRVLPYNHQGRPPELCFAPIEGLEMQS